MGRVHGGAPGGRAAGTPPRHPGARRDAGPSRSIRVVARRARRASGALAACAVIAPLLAGHGCGGADEGAVLRREDDRIYRVGLERVRARGGDPTERAALQGAYDAGYGAGAEEALAVDARADLEARRLGCRAIYPRLERAIARDGWEPPSREALCRPRGPAEIVGARHRGDRFERSRRAVVAEARQHGERRLGFLLVKAHEYGYERGFRRWRRPWDEEEARRRERAGCRDGIARALELGALAEIHEAPLVARCRALTIPGPSL